MCVFMCERESEREEEREPTCVRVSSFACGLGRG